MRQHPERLARLARAHESLARLLEARLLTEEAKARDIAAGLREMEASAQHIPVSFLPVALRTLTEADKKQKASESSAAILRRQWLGVEGRRRAVSALLDMADAERARRADVEAALDSALAMTKGCGKQGMVK